jgi:hypothetical protein
MRIAVITLRLAESALFGRIGTDSDEAGHCPLPLAAGRRAADRSEQELPIAATGSDLRHVGINRADASILESHFGVRAGWLPNLVERRPLPSAERCEPLFILSIRE